MHLLSSFTLLALGFQGHGTGIGYWQLGHMSMVALGDVNVGVQGNMKFRRSSAAWVIPHAATKSKMQDPGLVVLLVSEPLRVHGEAGQGSSR